jgi:hypothetical protein
MNDVERSDGDGERWKGGEQSLDIECPLREVHSVHYREASTERERETESIQINCLKKRGLKTSHINYSYNKI